MAYEKLKEHLARTKYNGVGLERIAVRTQGCWNCIHGSADKANERWWNEARQMLLQKAVGLAMKSPIGEKDQHVLAIRKGVPEMDAQMTKQEWVTCKVGKKADGTPVDDFVASTYLCSQWTAAQGASVAREGAAPDKLPEELMERLHERKVE